jgi:hypothetical protein
MINWKDYEIATLQAKLEQLQSDRRETGETNALVETGETNALVETGETNALVETGETNALVETVPVRAEFAILEIFFSEKTLRLMGQFLLDIDELEKKLNFKKLTLFTQKVFRKRGLYDEKRKQTASLESLAKTMSLNGYSCDDVLAAMKMELSEYVNEQDGVLGGGAVLLSLPGGCKQSWHRDYRRDSRLVSEPIAFLVPLSECRLDVRMKMDMTESTLSPLRLGSVLMLRGYTIHRGCDYELNNYRMHYYCVDRRDERFLKNLKAETKFISDTFSDEDSDLEDLAGVSPSLFERFHIETETL